MEGEPLSSDCNRSKQQQRHDRSDPGGRQASAARRGSQPDPNRTPFPRPGENFVDLLVMCALEDEQNAIIDPVGGVFGNCAWLEKENLDGDTYHVASVESDHGRLSVAVGLTAGRQGPLRMVKKTTSLLGVTRPRCAALVGVCAGNGDAARYGDVIVPHLVIDETGGGKRTADGFKPDGYDREGHCFGTSDQIQRFSERWKGRFLIKHERPDYLDGYIYELLSALLRYQTKIGEHPSQIGSTFKISEETARQLLDKFYEKRYLRPDRNGLYEFTSKGLTWFKSLKRPPARPRDFECVFNRHIVTVRDVEEHDEVFSRLQQIHGRNVVAVEREAIGFLEAVEDRVDNYFVAKAVQDYARFPKTDHYRMFAAQASAAFAIEYVTAHSHLLKGRPTPTAIIETSREPPPAGPLWSREWSLKQVGPWLTALTKHRERAIYIYGARKAGKSFLVSILREQLSQQTPRPRFVDLNLKHLIDQFKYEQSAQSLQRQILVRVGRQFDQKGGWHQAYGTVFDFASEFSILLANDPGRQVYLMIEEADSSLRLPDVNIRQQAVAATSPLFESLKSIMDIPHDPILGRIQAVLTGSTPAVKLAEIYDHSPFNNIHAFVLRRFTKAECDQLALAAGFVSDAERERLYLETGGHRALVWAILRQVGVSDDQSPGLPDLLDELPMVRGTLNTLETDLYRQPDLHGAFERVLCGGHVDFELLTRLHDVMLVGNVASGGCQCPLIERRFSTGRASVSADT
jgi:AAA-like domain